MIFLVYSKTSCIFVLINIKQLEIMSNYYNVDSLKIRVSDHEPNTMLNGSSDYYIYTNDAAGKKISIGGQIDKIIDKEDLELHLFEKIINDFADVDEECMYMQMELQR